MIRSAVEYDPPATRDRIREWQHELDLIAPRNDEVSWLHIGWISGDPWESSSMGEGYRDTTGVGRWCIYQMTPAKRLRGTQAGDLVLPDLEGPHPRTFGWWNARDRVFEQRKVCNVNRYQWDLYRETGCFAQPYWIVQGTKGGHLRRYTPVQQKIAQMNGGEPSPPRIGDLPYAEPDRRTWSAIAQMDLLRAYDMMIDFADRKPEHLEAAETRQVQEMRESLWTFLKGRQEDRWSEQRGAIRSIMNAIPAGLSGGSRTNPEAIHQRFVTQN